MAGRILNRRDLRKQADAAGDIESTPDESPKNAKVKKAREKKTATTPKVRKPRAKKAKPRFRVRWGIFNASMKQVAIYDYNQRLTADSKLAQLLEEKKGLYFMQPVKEEILEPVPVVETPAM